jgi:hypothetical protein
MRRNSFVVPATIAVAVLVFLLPWWPLGWRDEQYWPVAGALATALAAIGAFAVLILTYWLWREAAAQREGELMLRLIDEYDLLRGDIMHVREWYSHTAGAGIQPTKRFEFEAVGRFASFEELDQARFRVSRFFVRVRKLVRAGFLSEEVVLAALDRRAISDVFLGIVDPLDKVKGGSKYQATDRDFYEALLRRYPQEESK